MRTLKKTLSLVLVVAMVLGLCVVGASAKDAVENFTDDYQKVGAAYQEAMGVMVGVGIIDGMTATTYEPTGTLTGFQWAKMLLCAIGFGVKGEFTGSSWSVNTALVAHKVNLFAGDLDGDGELTDADIEMLQQYILGDLELTEDQMALMDYDGNGTVDIRDMIQWKKVLLTQE